MLYLIAQGRQRGERWRRQLPLQQTVIVGREAEPWSVGWDSAISRHHLELRAEAEDEVDARVLPEATNPVFHRGQRSRQFRLRSGETFVIGTTTFTLTNEQALPSLDVPQPDNERTYSLEFLRHIEYRQTHRDSM